MVAEGQTKDMELGSVCEVVISVDIDRSICASNFNDHGDVDL